MYQQKIETSRANMAQHNSIMKELSAARLKNNAKHRHLRAAKPQASPNRKANARFQRRLDDWLRMAADNKWGGAGFNAACYHRPGSMQ